jgi:small-conductance mechanosensitive channel
MADGLTTLIGQLLAALAEFVLYLVVGALLFVVLYAAGVRVLSWLLWQTFRSRARVRREPLTEQRCATLRTLIDSLMGALAVALALIFLLSRVVTPTALVTTIGLFSAGLGFAARPFISDVLGGIVLLFEDLYSVGEKVEIGEPRVIGVVEAVSLRKTQLRGEAGELWIVPNGDVRSVRNFSRGSFSPASMYLTVPTNRLDEALEILGGIAADPGPHVVEQPEIISEQGQIGETTELMLKVKAEHGYGPWVRRALLARIQAALTERQIIAQAGAADGAEASNGAMERSRGGARRGDDDPMTR